MSHVNHYTGYWNMPAYPNVSPVTSPTVYSFFKRADPYNPPVGLHFHAWGAQLSLDDGSTRWLAEALNSGATASGIASGLVAMGVITAPEAGAILVVSAIYKIGSVSINSANNLGGNKGVYFNIPWPVIPGAPLVASVPHAIS